MKGTWSAQPYCVALEGEIGQSVGCAIYDLRSSSCRELEEGSEQCHRARARWNLPPLVENKEPPQAA